MTVKPAIEKIITMMGVNFSNVLAMVFIPPMMTIHVNPARIKHAKNIGIPKAVLAASEIELD